ncbi:MAG TPA: hypothetical protein VFK13_10560 [Gemmatimonadaceae bacterium]|nr:hypothetical protein [Gemmatimonadaceae bacterium]
MAQIRIEEKRGGLAWLWIIVALIIAALILWYIFAGGRSATTTPAADSLQTGAVPLAASAVRLT